MDSRPITHMPLRIAQRSCVLTDISIDTTGMAASSLFCSIQSFKNGGRAFLKAA